MKQPEARIRFYANFLQGKILGDFSIPSGIYPVLDLYSVCDIKGFCYKETRQVEKRNSCHKGSSRD